MRASVRNIQNISKTRRDDGLSQIYFMNTSESSYYYSFNLHQKTNSRRFWIHIFMNAHLERGLSYVRTYAPHFARKSRCFSFGDIQVSRCTHTHGRRGIFITMDNLPLGIDCSTKELLFQNHKITSSLDSASVQTVAYRSRLLYLIR